MQDAPVGGVKRVKNSMSVSICPGIGMSPHLPGSRKTFSDWGAFLCCRTRMGILCRNDACVCFIVSESVLSAP